MTWGTIEFVKQHGLFKAFSSITVVWCYGTLPGYCSVSKKYQLVFCRNACGINGVIA